MMADRGAQPWQWPSLDRIDQPSGAFTPQQCSDGEEPRQAASEQAERLLRDSRCEAERLLEDARKQAEQIRRNAHSHAIQEARAVFDETLQQTVAEQTAAFTSARQALLKRIEDAGAERLDRLERELTGLVALMAEKVVRRTVEADDDVVVDVVRATLEQAAGAERFSVRVSAPDERAVRQAMAELLTIADSTERMEIIGDEALGRGGCIVETERGRFDARIETQLELLSREIGSITGEEETDDRSPARSGGADCRD